METVHGISIIFNVAKIINYLNKRKRRSVKKRLTWSRKWLLRRDMGEGMTNLLLKELQIEDRASFKNFSRMSVKSFYYLLGKVKPYIEKQDTRCRLAISTETRLLLTLRFLATGETYASLSYGFRVSVPAISHIVPETLDAIYNVIRRTDLKMPSTPDEWKAVASEFARQWNFPLCLGALDGKHIAICGKKDYGSYYYNYKGFNSIILLALVDANYRFLYIDVGANGRANDAAVFNKSLLCEGMLTNKFNFPTDEQLPGTREKVPYMIVADDAFRLSNRVLKPHGQRTVDKNRIFNYRLSRARRVVENAFGILSNTFQILQKPIKLDVEKAELITLACCALHNFIINEEGINSKLMDQENTCTSGITEGSWRKSVCLTKLERSKGNRAADDQINIRNIFTEYFNSTGAVPWQNEAVKKFNF